MLPFHCCVATPPYIKLNGFFLPPSFCQELFFPSHLSEAPNFEPLPNHSPISSSLPLRSLFLLLFPQRTHSSLWSNKWKIWEKWRELSMTIISRVRNNSHYVLGEFLFPYWLRSQPLQPKVRNTWRKFSQLIMSSPDLSYVQRGK